MITARRNTPGTSPNPPSMEVLRLGRRHQLREPKVGSTWGRLAPVGKLLKEDPQPTTESTDGADGERLAAHLRRALGDGAVVLTDRKVAARRGNVDHVVIAASGVWLIDAKGYRGMVEGRDVGGWFNIDYRLYVGGRDRTGLVAGLEGKVNTVRSALGEGGPAVQGALCFTDATWKVFAKPCRAGNVWITWADALVKRIAAPGPLAPNDVVRVAVKLDEALSPASPVRHSLAS